MPDFGMFGKLTSAPEDRESLLSILTQAAALMQNAPGCHSYIVSRDANDAEAIWVFELWDSKEAHDASLSLPGVRELIGQAGPLLNAAPHATYIQPVAGKGL